jgi:hypothetical protein
MAEFIKSKPTSFVNKPVGVVRADTGAIELGRAITQAGDTLQEIFWREAKEEALATDLEKARTLPILNKDGKLQYVKGQFSDIGRAKATEIVNKRYANQLVILAKKQLLDYKIKRTKNNNFDKEGFDEDAKQYIKSHILEFQKTRTRDDGSTYSLKDFIPTFVPKLQNLATLHSNDITNKRIEHEDRVAITNQKIVLNDKVQELEALTFNYNTNAENADLTESNEELFKEIQELKTEILTETKNLTGVVNGFSSTGAIEFVSKINQAATRGTIEPIVTKVKDNDTALKLIQSAFQRSSISERNKKVLLELGVTENEIKNILNARKDNNLRAPDVKIIAGELSVASGVAQSIDVKLGEELKSASFANRFNGGGTLNNNPKDRNALNDLIGKELGFELTTDSIVQLDKDTTNKLFTILSKPNVNILPSSVYDLLANDKIMARYRTQTPEVQNAIAGKILNIFQNVAYTKGTTDADYGDPLPKLNISNDIYKRMELVGFISRITGDPVHALNMASLSAGGNDNIDTNVLRTGLELGYKGGNPNKNNPNLVNDAADIVKAVLQDTDIPFYLHKDFSPYVRLFLNQKQVIGEDGNATGFDKDAVISQLNDTYKKLYVVDEMVYDIYSNDIKSPSYFSPKRKYPYPAEHQKFVDYVNKQIATDTNREGLGQDVFLLPDYRNTATNTNVYTLVDSNGSPIVNNAGNIIEIDTSKVDKQNKIQLMLEIKNVMNKDYANKMTTAIENSKNPKAVYKMLDDLKINPTSLHDNKVVGELFSSRDLSKTKPFGYNLSTQDLIAYNHAQDLYHSPTGTDMMEESLVGIPSEKKKQFRESMKLNLNLKENIASEAFTAEKKKLAELARKNLDAQTDSFENYKPPVIPREAIEQFNKGMKAYMTSTKDAVASEYDGDSFTTVEEIKDIFSFDVKPNMMPDRGDKFNLLSTGSRNPMWKTIYNNTLENIKTLPTSIQEVIKENFTPEVAIQIQDDLVQILKYTSTEEGYNAFPYKDATTVSVGAGFNIRYLTDEEINLIPSERRRKFLFDARAYLEKHKVGNKNQTKTADEAFKYINNQLQGGKPQTVVGKRFKVILPEEANLIFAQKIMTIMNSFQKDFSNFAELPVEHKIAMVDFAYQHGYQSHKSNWRKYWASITSALTTKDVNLREFFFNRAGYNMIYNYEQFEDVDGAIMVTGKTKAVRQFDEYGSTRYYDRAENLGFTTDARPTYLGKGMRKLNRAFEVSVEHALQGFGL